MAIFFAVALIAFFVMLYIWCVYALIYLDGLKKQARLEKAKKLMRIASLNDICKTCEYAWSPEDSADGRGRAVYSSKCLSHRHLTLLFRPGVYDVYLVCCRYKEYRKGG